MRISISIDTDNAAFENNFYRELSRLLSLVPRKVAQCQTETVPEVTKNLLDENGNMVGRIKVEGLKGRDPYSSKGSQP